MKLSFRIPVSLIVLMFASFTSSATEDRFDVKSIEDGLEAYYPFDGDANDYSGNEYHGTVSGATLCQDRFGNEGNAYYFDGTNDYVITSFFPVYELSDSFTIAFWVKTTDDANNRMIGFERTDYQEISISPSSAAGRIYLRGDNHVSCYCSSTASISDDIWHHVAFTRNTTADSVSVFVDGVFSNSIEDLTTSVINSSASRAFAIGCNNHSSGFVHFFNGSLDNVRFYNLIITQNQIDSLVFSQISMQIAVPDSTTEWSEQQTNTTVEWENIYFNSGSTVMFEIYRNGDYMGIYHDWTSNDGIAGRTISLDPLWISGEYRLKAIDSNENYGWSDYFSIVPIVNLHEDTFNPLEVVILHPVTPNPITELGSAMFNLPTSGQAQLYIRDVSGRVVWSKSSDFSAGNHCEVLPSLSNGLYYFSLIMNGSEVINNFVILK